MASCKTLALLVFNPLLDSCELLLSSSIQDHFIGMLMAWFSNYISWTPFIYMLLLVSLPYRTTPESNPTRFSGIRRSV